MQLRTTCLIEPKHSLTYLNLITFHRLANELRSRGVDSGSLVALALDRSVEFVKDY